VHIARREPPADLPAVGLELDAQPFRITLAAAEAPVAGLSWALSKGLS